MNVLTQAFFSSSLACDVLEWLASPENFPSYSGLIVAAHPDDEVIGLGSRLPYLGTSSFIHVTDGAPRNLEYACAHGFTNCADYANCRREEFFAALKITGLSRVSWKSLQYPDQETSFHLVELTNELCELIVQSGPEFILTHPYEGGHPDHDSTCFAVHCACALLNRQGYPVPALLEFSSYHNGPNGIQAGVFLGHPTEERSIVLTSEERVMKLRMFGCFATQRYVLSFFPINIERFRIAPVSDFSAAPHSGTLFYEHFSWGLNGERWRELAAEAMQVLELGKEQFCESSM